MTRDNNPDPTITLQPMTDSGTSAAGQIYARYAVIAGLILLLPIAMEIALQNWIGAGKLIVVYFVLATSVVSFAIIIYRALILEKLSLLEQLADIIRDESSAQLETTTQKLSTLNQRLFDKQDATTQEILPDLFKSLGPFAMLLMSRETSLVKWGMIGAKFAKNAFELWKAQNKK